MHLALNFTKKRRLDRRPGTRRSVRIVSSAGGALVMSRTYRKFLVFALTAVMATPLPTLSNVAQAAAPAKQTSHYDAFKNDKGEFFAISLSPVANLEQADAAEVVVLFDTSASQVGPYREKAIDALRGMLGAMNAKDRVNLMAVDLKAVPMTNGFVAPNGPEMKAALDKLNRRVPLGSTDMEIALKAARDSYQGKASAPRSVV